MSRKDRASCQRKDKTVINIVNIYLEFLRVSIKRAIYIIVFPVN